MYGQRLLGQSALQLSTSQLHDCSKLEKHRITICNYELAHNALLAKKVTATSQMHLL